MRNANIFLAAGLPLAKFGKEKPDFINYLFKNKQVIFRFEKEIGEQIFTMEVVGELYHFQLSECLPHRMIYDRTNQCAFFSLSPVVRIL